MIREINAHQHSRIRGSVMIYSVVMIAVLCGFVSLAVDLGRVQLVKAELQRIADASSLYAASGLPSISSVQSLAQQIANQNPVDGGILTYQTSDVEIGYWNTSSKSFTVNGSPTNAVRIYARKLSSRGTAVPLMFGSMVGMRSVNVNTSSIALWTSGTTQTFPVSGKNSVTYYGLPDGTVIPDPWGGDTVDSSMRPTEISVMPGQTINFSVTGTVTYQTWSNDYNAADGFSWSAGMQQPAYANSNGFSDVNAPGLSLVGAFVGSGSSSVPAALDFSTTATTDVTRVIPQLKQQFFVGGGKQSTGLSRSYVVPSNANKIIFGIADSWIWRDNGGTFSVTMTTSGSAKLVK